MSDGHRCGRSTGRASFKKALSWNVIIIIIIIIDPGTQFQGNEKITLCNKKIIIF